MKRTATYLLSFLLILNLLQGQSLQELMNSEMAYAHFNGCILVQKNGIIEYQNCAGQADRDNMNTSQTAFDIGSLSKQFTAAAILHLVDDGKIGLHEPINKYLAGSASETWDEVTVHHLLTHSSGIPSLYHTGHGFDDIMPSKEYIPLTALISYFQNKPLQFEPGEQYRYSNSGYILLAAIIESSSGLSYDEYIVRMAKKYELNSISFGNGEVTFARPFYGYRSDLMSNAPINHKSWMIGAGGIYSSIEDLQKWLTIIQSKDFLTEHTRNQFFGHHQGRGENKFYGYGWDIKTKPETLISHDGANFGYISYFGFKPTTKSAVIILTNQSFSSVNMISRSSSYISGLTNNCWSILNGEKVDVLPMSTNDRPVTGSYVFDDGYVLNIEQINGEYFVSNEKGYIPARKIFQREIEEDGPRHKALKLVASAFEKNKYWSMAKVCDWKMKGFIYTGIFSWGFGEVSSGLGGIKSAVAYSMNEGRGLIRLTGENEILDVVVYFNDEDKVQGVFENGWYEQAAQIKMRAFPISPTSLYMDGFPYGEFSATIELNDDSLNFRQLDRLSTALPLKISK